MSKEQVKKLTVAFVVLLIAVQTIVIVSYIVIARTTA